MSGKRSIQRCNAQFLILGEGLGVPLTGVLWGEEMKESSRRGFEVTAISQRQFQDKIFDNIIMIVVILN